MTAFAIFNEFGEILRTGEAPDEMIAMQSVAGEFVFVGHVEQTEYYIDTQTKTPVKKPQKPTGDYQFDYAIKMWAPTVKDPSVLAQEARVKRRQLLGGTDWTQLPDVPQSTQQLWATYRQALRDLPLQPGFPIEIIWPTPPI